jgi:FtsP/CotA-like multicopper oxidase with cupredoxin domain
MTRQLVLVSCLSALLFSQEGCGGSGNSAPSLTAQTITFSAPTSPVTYGVAPIALSATASSGLAVTFSVTSGPGTLSGSTLTITGAGTVVVAASQAGNSTYAAAATVSQSVVVNQAPQTIGFTALTSPVLYGVPPIGLSATATSALAVTFTVSSGPGTIGGSTLTLTGSGTVVVAANQAGNTNYAAAPTVSQSVVVNIGVPQTISFTAPATPITYGAAPVALAATASSGLAVAYAVTGPATLTAGTLTYTGAGAVSVTLSQPGNTVYSPAPSIVQTVVVNKASLTVTANSFSILAGQPLPTLTAILSGFVNADTAANAVTGAPSLTSSPSLTTPGNYAITAATGTLASTNYSFVSFANGTLAVQPTATSGSTLVIPPLLLPVVDSSGVKHFSMNMLKGTTNVLSGVPSTTEGFNGVWMAPTIAVNNGDQVAMAITNMLGEVTTVHWHGFHVPAIYDGGVFGTFNSGTTYTPSFAINQQAATLWYHPHVMGTTARGVSLGLVGEFIIGDSSTASSLLPNTYGINDIPLELQQAAIATNGVIAYAGNALTAAANYPLLLNGLNVSTTPAILNTGQNRLRFRVLNGSIGSSMRVSMSDNSSFTMVASDGGYLTRPSTVTSISLGPAERAEIIVDLTPNSTRTLVTAATGVAAGFPLMSPGVSILNINSSATATASPLPLTLNTITPYSTATATTRTITLTNTGGFGIDGLDVLQLSQFAQTAIQSKLGNTEVWNIVEQTGLPHYFHMHDVQFQVLSINGNPPPPSQAGWKDTEMIPANATVQIVMQFLDYSDSSTPYMLHCHIVLHEDQGMMAIFYVNP